MVRPNFFRLPGTYCWCRNLSTGVGKREISAAENNVQHIPRKDGWESAIGLEIHAQISSKSKIFSPGSTQYGAPVNTAVSLFDAAIPGTLPVLNQECVRAGALTAMALSCEVSRVSTFDRKHYFYADLPAGYQITQQRQPLAKNGELLFTVYNPAVHKQPYNHKCKITQLQLEQDSGKSLHDDANKKSLIDLNRAGVGLMEIVFEPQLRDGEEAAALVKELILILESYGTCNCRMEEGALRVDANISVNRVNEPLGVRTEVKNLGSIRSVAAAVEYEVKRQIKELEDGRSVVNETRSYDTDSKMTVPMRDKEVKQDYRFMPEPNLPPLRLTYDPSDKSPGHVNIAQLRYQLKELPEVTRKKLVTLYGLRLQSAIIIVEQPGLLAYFNRVMASLDSNQGVGAANLLIGPVLELLNDSKSDYTKCSIAPEKIADTVRSLKNEEINAGTAQAILKLLHDGDSRAVEQIINEENMGQLNDLGSIQEICQSVLSEDSNLVSVYGTSKQKKQAKIFMKFMTAAHKKGQGRLNMKKASEIMQNLLHEHTGTNHKIK